MATRLNLRHMLREPDNRLPTPGAALLFWCKTRLLILRRALRDLLRPVLRWPSGNAQDYPILLAESRTPLWSAATDAERALQQGKVQNLRCALRRLDGSVIAEEGVFSFWKQVGRASQRRGYVPGRQLQEGCLIPAIGGGLCQLSNALYDIALQAGAEIVERHPHTRIVPGSLAASGRDATVAWNYIDLRFRPAQPVRLEAKLSADELIVRMWGQGVPVTTPGERNLALPQILLPLVDTRPPLDPEAHSCASCGVEACFRHSAPTVVRLGREFPEGRTAHIVDERWPEFERYLAQTRNAGDILCLPLDGARWKQPRYRWQTAGYASCHTATWQTLDRALTSRRLSRYGAERLQAQLKGAAELARALAQGLLPDVTQVTVAQSLLPFLWQEGHLGGRRFTVLMNRLPLQTLHTRLDAALQKHPERQTLGEFRAPAWLVAAEADALAAAEHIVTPHSEIAALFPAKATLLEWNLQSPRTITSGSRILFPGPTAARKGAYELRAVARALNLEIVLLGSELEGDTFWEGVSTVRKERGAPDCLEGIAAVVQPALVEDQPRVLLAALSAGIPVVATPACGLGSCPGVHTIPAGDEAYLYIALNALLEALESSVLHG